VTLPALLPPGVPLDVFGVLSFFEELDLDLGRAEGDGDDVREEGDDRRDDDGVDDRSASRTYLGFWIDFLRALLEEVVSSSSSTNLGGAFFFLVERLDMLRLVLVRKATSVGLFSTTNCEQSLKKCYQAV